MLLITIILILVNSSTIDLLLLHRIYGLNIIEIYESDKNQEDFRVLNKIK